MDDSNKSVKELRALCKQKKIKGITGKSKDELLALLQPTPSASPTANAAEPVTTTAQTAPPTTPFYTANALHALSIDKRTYSCIYLDPPYASGRDYKYAEQDTQAAFTDKFTPAQYKEWLTKLIQACKSRLAANGTLWFHIAAEYSFIPEQILQAEFKDVEKIFWKKSHGKNTVKSKMGAVIDILFRCWSGPSPTFHLQYVPLDAYYFEHSYKNKDERGLYALGSLRFDKTRSGNSYEVKHDGVTYKAPYGWKVKKEEMDRLLAEGRIHFVLPNEKREGNLYKKLYKDECKGKPLSNLWDDISYITRTQQDPRTYPTQKPLKLLQRILAISSNPGDWILDPTAGSGTTGIAASGMGRNCVLIDINPDAKKIFESRLAAAAAQSDTLVEEDSDLTDNAI
jgi:DNA modification methylase